jgi:gamma-glutamyltranspeptidase/glutathione hydrolase
MNGKSKGTGALMACKRAVTWLSSCLLAACVLGIVNSSARAEPGGLVVGDEPLAVQAGADILRAGGSAADAAAATYFTLAVTYPVAAGLGGGGICLLRDPDRETAESINFLPRNARSGGPFAVPGNVRGFALLQSMHGRLPWQSVVAKGERLATLGFPMSRALAERVAGSANIVRLDAGLAKVFMDESGRMHREGDVLRNADLGASLAMLRTTGPGSMYGGKLGGSLVSYARQQNSPIAADEFANYAPTRVAAGMTTIGEETVYLPAGRTGAGKLAAQVFANLAGRDVTSITSTDVAAGVTETLRGFGVGALPNDLGATGFAAVDDEGQAVACAVTMSGPFGSGRTAEGTGITLATAPSSSNVGLSVAFLTTVIASEGESGPLMMLGAGAGGPDATAAIFYDVVAGARNETLQTAPASAGPRLSVNVIVCLSGGCSAIPSPSTHGMGAVVGGQ